MNFCIVIPCYEPDEKLIALLESFSAPSLASAPIILVNDGSSSASAAIFSAAANFSSVSLLSHPRNLGKGAALKTAFREILRNRPDCDFAITADCDGQHTAADISKIVERLQSFSIPSEPRTFHGGEKKVPFVLGCRDFSAAGIPARSRFGNRFSACVYRCVGVRVSDTQTGLRAIHRSLFPRLLHVKYDRYEFETLMLISARAAKNVFVEVPISTIYIEENKSSHFHPLRDSFRIYRVLFHNIIRQISSFFLASFVSAAIDLALFTLLFYTAFSSLSNWRCVFWSTFVARVISAFCNYYFNRKLVFRFRPRNAATGTGSFIAYAALAVAVVCLSAFCVTEIREFAPSWHPTLAKALVDTFLFILSFVIQKYVIFRFGGRQR